jgi:hypothetical protein
MYSRIVRYSAERDHLTDLRPRRWESCVDRCPRHARVCARESLLGERATHAAQQKDSRAIARNGASMISSEVQRTLVKSPPELWAEISDPEALARHLGEFGEIRITRMQPEQKVEWEAPDASGSIVIKPSGWGTKVKLTVTRELSETDTATEPGETSEPGQDAQDSTIEAVRQVQGAAALELETEAAGESEPRDELEATEAEILAQELLAEEQLEQAEGPVAASLPLEDLEGQSEHDPLPGTASEGEPQPEHEPEAQPARRLGFFARLFGRRRVARMATDEEPDLHMPEMAEDEYSDPAHAADEVTASAETPTYAADQVSVSNHDLTLAPEVALVETELDAEPTPAPATPRTPGSITPATQAAANASEATNPPELDGAVENLSPSEAHADIAAELERAEEAAEEQVTAVLTGVLDRLGSAHHRPFSRA